MLSLSRQSKKTPTYGNLNVTLSYKYIPETIGFYLYYMFKNGLLSF